MNANLPATMTYSQRRARVQRNMAKLAAAQPKTLQGFNTLHRAGAEAGALDAKTKELIALAIAVASRCDDGINFHTNYALKAGANEAEITDALGVAIVMGGGLSLMYATHVMEAIADFNNSGECDSAERKG